jgi:hypothetical protein
MEEWNENGDSCRRNWRKSTVPKLGIFLAEGDEGSVSSRLIVLRQDLRSTTINGEVANNPIRTDSQEDLCMEQYWDSIRQTVCRKCIDGDGKGGCRLPIDESCGLDKFFPEILQTVSTVRSDSYQDYVEALRANVCANCEHQFSNGVCKKRDTLECALDRYLPVVIEVIESVKMSAVGTERKPS